MYESGSNNQLMQIDALKKEFCENGAVCLRNIFSSEWINKVKIGIDYNIKYPSKFAEFLREDEASAVYFNDYCNWTRIAEFNDYVRNSPAAEIAATLMDSKYSVFYHEHVLNKEAGATKKTPWHHDQPYYPFDGLKTCSIWMPIDHISKENCVEYVKGSHVWNQLFTPRKFSTNKNYLIEHSTESQQYQEMPDIDGNRNNYEILSWELQPGDCIAFSMKTIHGAAGNLSVASQRRVLATRWFGDDVTFTSRPWIVSPPMSFGLSKGDPPYKSELLPIIWGKCP